MALQRDFQYDRVIGERRRASQSHERGKSGYYQTILHSHLPSPWEMSNRVARPTRRTSHRHERLKIGLASFCLGGVPPELPVGSSHRATEAGSAGQFKL